MYPTHQRRRAVDLLDSGNSFNEVSRTLGINRSTLRTWHRDRTLIDKYGDSASCPRCAPAPRPPASPTEYTYLLGLYLGDGCISPAGDRKKGVWSLRIMCADSWPGLIESCRAALGAVAPGHKIGTVQKVGCTEVLARWKHWPCLFPQHGSGPKHSRKIALAPWQVKLVHEHPHELVKGLFHSDGCRVANTVRRKVAGEWKYYAYPRYFFSNTSQDIHGILGSALDLISAEWKLTWKTAAKDTHRDTGVLSVAKRDSVALLDTFIGPKS